MVPSLSGPRSSKALRFRQAVDDVRIYDSTCRLLESQCRVSGVREIMSSVRSLGGRPFLCAGAVRDALRGTLTGIALRPRDYDIAIAVVSHEHFDAFAASLGARRNQYGGYQVSARDGLNVDLWRIEDTVGVLANGCRPTITNVLRTFVIDLNAVAYDPTENVLHDQGCLGALHRREIGFVRNALLHDHSNFAGRALALQYRFPFRLSCELRDFVAGWYDSAEAERQKAKADCVAYSSGLYAAVGTTPDASYSESAAVCFE